MVDYSAARKAMVDHQVETSSVNDPALLSAMRRIPRELFLAPERRPLAYSDAHHPIANGRFLSAPAVFARLVQLAAIEPTDRVLDFCPGTGYSTAILSALAAQVMAFEPDQALNRSARQTLSGLDLANVTVLPSDTPETNLAVFDVIVIETAVFDIPDLLLDRLAVNGRLVALVRQGPIGVATLCTRTPDGVTRFAAFNATLPLGAQEQPTENFVF